MLHRSLGQRFGAVEAWPGAVTLDFAEHLPEETATALNPRVCSIISKASRTFKKAVVDDADIGGTE